MIRVTRIRNIFQPAPDSELIQPWREKLRVEDLVPPDVSHYVIWMNQRKLPKGENPFVPPEAEVVIGEVPRVIGTLAVAGAPWWGSLFVTIVDAVILYAISRGIAALSAPRSEPDALLEEQTSRGFSGVQNTVGAGHPIPFLLGGPIRIGGQVLQTFEKQITGAQVRDGETTLHTMISLGHGPIESISEPYIDGNPASLLPQLTTETRLGNTDQKPLAGFADIHNIASHARPITQADDFLEFSTTREVEAVEIMFLFPQGLASTHKETGKISPYTVEFDIQIREIGGDEFANSAKIVSGYARNPFKAIARIDGLELGTYLIRIRRLTTDVTEVQSSYYVSESQVLSIDEITSGARAHPGLALVGFSQIPTAQIRVPERYTFLCEGDNQCRIYSDADNYTTGYSNNNAWCCARFLTMAEGLDDEWENIDIPSFLDWAAKCDTMVSDGKGGLEKFSTFAHYFDSVQPADDLVQYFGEGCGVSIQKRAGKWRAIIDEEASPLWVGTHGNILADTFELEPIPSADRANRIELVFQDGENDYQRTPHPEMLPDLAADAKINVATRRLNGVTRRSQVIREAVRLLLHNKFATEMCRFSTGLDALRLGAGAVFGVSQLTAGIGIASGRLVSVDSTLTQLTLDEEVTIEAGKTYEITVHHADGDVISTKRVVAQPGTWQTIGAADASWTGTIAAEDVYALGEFDASMMLFRCINTSLTSKLTRQVEGLRYDPQVYSGDLSALPTIVPTSIPDPRLLPPNAEDLTLLERQEFLQDGTLVDVLDVTFTPPIASALDYFQIWLRRLEENYQWELRGTTEVGHFEIGGLESPGFTYEVSVVSVSQYGSRVAPEYGVKAAITTEGLLTQPSNLGGLRADIIDGTLVATVDALPVGELGPQGGYEWRLGSSWEQSILIDTTTNPRIEIKSYPRGTFTLLVKAVNSVGNKSPTAASVSVTLRGQIEENIVYTSDEAPSWGGTLTGFVVEGGTNKLVLYEPATSITYTLMPQKRTRGGRWWGFGAPAAVPLVRLEGYYQTDAIEVSAGEIILARPDVAVGFEAIYIDLGAFEDADFAFNSAEAQIPFSGYESEKVQVIVEVSTSTTTADESSFSAWSRLRDRGELSMRWIRFRLHAVVDSDAYTVKISSMTVSIDLPDKELSSNHVQGAATSFTVTYPTDYFVAVKRLLVTVIGGAVGDTVRITAQSAVSFTAEIRDSGGSLSTGTIHYSARGY